MVRQCPWYKCAFLTSEGLFHNLCTIITILLYEIHLFNSFFAKVMNFSHIDLKILMWSLMFLSFSVFQSNWAVVGIL